MSSEDLWVDPVDFWRAAHFEEAFDVLNLMRLNTELCDVELVAAGRRIPAHRLVLAACSPYFRAMFTGAMTESRQREVEIQGVDPDALELLVVFCYTARVTLTEGNAESLLAESDALGITRVKDACAEFLKREIRPSNCLGIRSFADAHSCSSLLYSSHRFALTHFVEVSQTEEFMTLPLDDMLGLVSSDEVHVQSEEDVFKAAVSWVKYDPAVRKQWLGEILTRVRLELLSKEFLMTHVDGDEMVKAIPACKDLLETDNLPEQSMCRPQKSPVLIVLGKNEPDGNEDIMACYDPTTDQWSVITQQHTSLYNMCSIDAAAITNNEIYVIRGYDPRCCMSMDIVEVYLIQEKSWSVLPPMGTSRASPGVAILDGCLYAIGGFDTFDESALNSVERYDTVTKQWTSVAPMNKKR